MADPLTAIEVTGTVDEHHQLRLDQALPIAGPTRVRVIVLYPLDEKWDEKEWLRAATRSPAFSHLKEAAEDIYTINDGEPFRDEM